jgi:hypothetical protein
MPTYFVYAASYHPGGGGDAPEEPAYTIEHFCGCRTTAEAVAALVTYL